MAFAVQRTECSSVRPSSCCTPGSRFSGSSAYDRNEHSTPVASLSLLMNHADGSDHVVHRCLSLVNPPDHFTTPGGGSEWRDRRVIRIDRRSFAGWCALFGVNWLSSVCRGALVAGGDSKRPCSATRSGDRQKQERAGVVLLLPASVVLGVILDRICFKALQLLRRVQWGDLPCAGESLNQSQ